ncbi:ABC transporter permease [Corynebacterium lubricantis]|uniref:ABC transporter permease n=1 Tax=Corynebacterium lubricantis TaxID=541095 RepID=UPI000373C494|nr:ABC transporter permease [Corynebacterium lubricantis]
MTAATRTTVTAAQNTAPRQELAAQRKPAKNSPRWVAQVGVLFAVIALWWAATKIFHINPVVLPGPQLVLQEVVDASRCVPVGEGSARLTCGEQGYFLWQHLAATLQRIAVGLGAGIIVGVLLGWALASAPRVRSLVEPYITFLRALPPMGYIGLLIVWFGIGDGSKVILLFLATFPIVTVGTLGGFVGVREDWVRAARTLGAKEIDVFRSVRLPGAAPEILSSIRLASSAAWASIVAAEINDGIPGIGGLAYVSGTQLNTAMAIGAIVIIGLVALLMDQIIVWIDRRVNPWRGK